MEKQSQTNQQAVESFVAVASQAVPLPPHLQHSLVGHGATADVGGFAERVLQNLLRLFRGLFNKKRGCRLQTEF